MQNNNFFYNLINVIVVGWTYWLLWNRFPLRFAEPQEVQAVLLHSTSSGLRLKRDVYLCRAGSAGEQNLVLQTPPTPLLDSGLSGSG